MVGMPAILAAFIASAIGGVPTFDAPIEIQFPNAQYPTQPAVADFDRDGQLDLVVPGRNTTGLVAIVLRHPDGSFDASRTISIGVQTDWAEAADFDGDGLQDIALGVRATFGAVAIVRGHGDGTFDPAILFATERETRCVRVGDMNHDGRPDFVAVNYGSHSIQVFHDNIRHSIHISDFSYFFQVSKLKLNIIDKIGYIHGIFTSLIQEKV